MMEANDLILDAAAEMHIDRGDNENENNWINRVTYSAIGRMAYASLWDNDNSQNDISKTYFKSRIKSLYEGWISVFPFMDINSKSLIEELSDYILKLYSDNGVVLNLPFRLKAAKEIICSGKNCSFVRSPRLNRSVFYSGLGAYFPYISKNETVITTTFGIDSHTLNEISDYYLSHIEFENLQYGGEIEYLRVEPPFSKGYWKRNADKNGIVSLMRIASEGGHFYYFYKYNGQDFVVSQIPEWLSKDGMYRKISTSLLYAYGQLPSIEYSVDGNVIILKQNYLLPPEELNLIQLYSWPRLLSNPTSPFIRKINVQCFEEIKTLLEEKGYLFTEV